MILGKQEDALKNFKLSGMWRDDKCLIVNDVDDFLVNCNKTYCRVDNYLRIEMPSVELKTCLLSAVGMTFC